MGLACTCVLCAPQPMNGLCTCRGWWEPHPFHGPSQAPPPLTDIHFVPMAPEYQGRHRPEYVRPQE